MRARRIRTNTNDLVQQFESFGSFSAIREFVDTQTALKISSYDNKGTVMSVSTDNGTVQAYKGDYVIKTPNGSLFVMKEGVFNALYEQTTSMLEIEEIKAERQRVCKMILDTMRDKGVTTFLKLEDMIR